MCDILERFAKVRVDSRGRISIPRRFMEKSGINPRDDVYVKICRGRLEVYTTKTVDDAVE